MTDDNDQDAEREYTKAKSLLDMVDEFGYVKISFKPEWDLSITNRNYPTQKRGATIIVWHEQVAHYPLTIEGIIHSLQSFSQLLEHYWDSQSQKTP